MVLTHQAALLEINGAAVRRAGETRAGVTSHAAPCFCHPHAVGDMDDGDSNGVTHVEFVRQCHRRFSGWLHWGQPVTIMVTGWPFSAVMLPLGDCG
jgi:hypothetical protein